MSVWGYWNELPKCVDNKFYLTGFANFGSIQLTDLKYGNTISISADVEICGKVKDLSALIDLDFNRSFTTFFSLVISEDYITLVFQDKGVEQAISIKINNTKGNSFNFKVLVQGQRIYFYLNNDNIFAYNYSDQLESCAVSFGNNDSEMIDKFDIDPIYILSNIDINTEYDNIPLNTNKLLNLNKYHEQ